ncbi:hypothetical protein TRICHSKD4_1830 [Roseibium sp. TrichSKD4]|uniref:DUF1653 domain-containing protein n=1 Tax=Roseibium sp. TrichSKD4 TaxID=744980 RepID=UPI0001E56C94|nr:DUF1653 domain-containing protein [Roseibium sp. TrichSKD4]EFO31625.1 hypothetical protein TRICHSKD4_2712 [Roseibium sp. TrichSKD4]EFO33204.1 hypothetical protein TRICHSKD4_1830 [Roseibium sp. TrichSKD4]
MPEFNIIEARRNLAVVRHDIGIESHWKHVKRGTEYWVQAVALREEDREPVVIYRDCHTGTCWVRPTNEFLDGRFERLSEFALKL